ncbi:MAG: hypothetical protein Q9210_001819 [Variospora velana]
MKEYVEPRGGWRDFNDWFARSVKPGYRPVAAISDPHVIVNPADYTYGGQWEIRSDTGVTIKGLDWNINELLKDCPYRNEFNGGMFMHGFLGPNDYHRQYCPLGRKVVWARNIKGDVYLEVHAIPIPGTDGVKTLVPYRSMDGGAKQFDATPRTPPGTNSHKTAAWWSWNGGRASSYTAYNIAQVSSVILMAEEGVTLTEGEEISYFQFGGSDIVMVFQRQSNVNITATHYRMGTVLGYAYPAGK